MSNYVILDGGQAVAVVTTDDPKSDKGCTLIEKALEDYYPDSKISIGKMEGEFNLTVEYSLLEDGGGISSQECELVKTEIYA